MVNSEIKKQIDSIYGEGTFDELMSVGQENEKDFGGFVTFKETEPQSQAHGAVKKYPLTNISHDESTDLIFIEIACAGFAKSDIDMKIEKGHLIISGSIRDEENVGMLTYSQRDIATRDFERKIELEERYAAGEIQANYIDGLLTISILPSKPFSKKIKIT